MVVQREHEVRRANVPSEARRGGSPERRLLLVEQVDHQVALGGPARTRGT